MYAWRMFVGCRRRRGLKPRAARRRRAIRLAETRIYAYTHAGSEANSPPAQFGTSTAGSRRMRQLTTRFGLLVCTSLAIMVTSNGGAPAILSSNPLKDLPALRTPHLSWPFPEPGQCTRVWFSPDGFASNFGAIAPLLQGTWVTTAPRAATSPTAQWRSLTAFCTTSYESLAPAHLD